MTINYFLTKAFNKMIESNGPEQAYRQILEANNSIKESAIPSKEWKRVLSPFMTETKSQLDELKNAWSFTDVEFMDWVKKGRPDGEFKEVCKLIIAPDSKFKKMITKLFDGGEINELGFPVIIIEDEWVHYGETCESTKYIALVDKGVFILSSNYLITWDKLRVELRNRMMTNQTLTLSEAFHYYFE